MICSLSELRRKEVINIEDGEKLGFVDDIEIDTETSAVISLVVYGRPRLFGLFGRDDDMIIKCDEICVIGKDTILIKQDRLSEITKRRGFSFETLYK